MSRVHDLGVTGHDRDSRSSRGTAHGLGDHAEFVERHPFLKDQAHRQGQRFSATDCEIVDGAVDREVPDIASREEAGTHHVGVGRERQASATILQHGRVAELFEHSRQLRSTERRQEQMAHQFPRQPTPSSMAHHDGRLVAKRQWARPVLEIRTVGHADTSRRRNW